MRILRTFLAWLVTLLLVAAVAFALVIVLAGPHAGLLPHWLEIVVLAVGWLCVLIVSALVARRVWRRG